MNKQQKQEAVAGLRERFSKAKGLVLTEYKGLTVAEMNDLRDTLRGSSIEYRVVKNTLARIAADGTPLAAARDHFVGPIGLALGYDDAAAMAKSVLGFAKKQEKLKVVGGVVEGAYCDEGQLRRIAELPSREVMLGMLAGTMNAPATLMAQLLSATVARLGYALGALKDKKAQ